MKTSVQHGKAEPRKPFLSRKIILVFAIIRVLGLVLFGLQELILRVSGYEDDLYDDSRVSVVISGTVVDINTQEPVAGARVGAEGFEPDSLTDERGCFKLALRTSSTNGDVLIRVEKEGYKVIPAMPAEYSEGKAFGLKVNLTPLSGVLESE